ncbi:MAG: hypothetical protein HZC55_23440 [Verrucomicrobia bacterium]|nr:hypothetical protein [Verrucomicrobiota bacterium]
MPVGHGMMGGYWKATAIADPLLARGFVLWGGDGPVVVVAVDWCEIRNEAYDRWREVLAAAAGTTRERVLVMSVHQHEAPVADLAAQRAVEARSLADGVCDPAFHEAAVQRVADSLRQAARTPRAVTHLGRGEARVDRIASNRRYLLPDGRPSFNRGSAAAINVLAREAPEGTIDPWLRTLSFWEGDVPIVAFSTYATHPMSYYRTGEVSADFPGVARARRQLETPGCLQIYASGASGNVTAGKYNDGSRAFRGIFAERLHAAMAEAWRATRREPLRQVAFCSAPVRLPPREDPAFSEAELVRRLDPARPAAQRNHAALGLGWRERIVRDQPIDVPAIDFGPAQLLLLPAESYVEFQLAAQRLRPDQFVVVAGYGESGPGYIPTEQARAENDTNLGDWCWVGPGCEPLLREAIRKALGSNAP